ncbi:MAG TPA: amino acid adenylation domain-containing protein [Pyrinomonadaceae bacterium]|jgi:amino acid adenylation domain-containing protein
MLKHATDEERRDREGIAERYPLTHMQEGMLFHSLYARQSGVDVQQLVCALDERLDVAAFEQAWRRVVERYAVLRTTFRWHNQDEPSQEVHRQVAIPLERHDWRGLSVQERQARLTQYLLKERRRGFDIDQAPLMRLSLFELDGDACQFVWTFHHALLDTRSLRVVLEEVFAFYDVLRVGGDLSLEPARPFRDYVEWLQAQQKRASSEQFWRQDLSGFTSPTPLVGAGLPVNANVAANHAEQEVQISRELNEALRALARRRGLSLETLALGVWSLMLGRYSGESDVVCGVTRAHRPSTLDGAETMVGLLINTLPARVRVPPPISAHAWLKELEAQQTALEEHAHAPLVQIQKWSDVPAGVPLFESLVILEERSLNSVSIPNGDAHRRLDLQLIEQTNYPLTLTAHVEPEFRLKVSYDTSRFAPATIARLLGHLRTLLEGIAADDEQRLSTLPMLTKPERRQLLREWNNTARPTPKDVCLHQLLEAQAARVPDRVAVRFEGEQLTYRELNERANRVAHRLRALGVGTETRVGLLMERSPDTFAALFGILKAGGAYVPLDPMHPPERLAFMLEDAQAHVLLTETHLLENLPAHATQGVVCLDKGWQASASESAENLTGAATDEATSDNLAYVIYTSGSTGKPKGVQIPHRTVVNLLHSMREQPAMNEGDALLAITTFSFDMAVPDIYLPLMMGARIELVSRETAADARRLLVKLKESGATVLQATPSTWRMLVEAGWQGDSRLKALCGAEAFPRDLADQLLARAGAVWNLYGPTETTVWSTVYRVEAGATATASVPVGRPIANTQIYLLDAQMQPVPVGTAGELYIGGDGLARGYLNRPDLTAERFVPNPFADTHGARLYRTGDAARYLPDGQIEYINRLDNQVKVRGFRIELGEIEARLRQHASVREAVAVVRDDIQTGGKTLVAYVVSQAGAEASAGELREFLKSTLPEYMLPAFFVPLDALPLTANGKVNRRALPAPKDARGASEKTFVAPRDALEIQLAKIWEGVLDVRPVGITDNFFESGGDSLLAVRLFIRVEEAFGKNLPLATLIQTPTIEGLADVLRGENRTPSWSSLVPIQPVGTKPPFFCVHGVGGNVLNYRALAKHLGAEQPFYGLQSQGLDGQQPPLTRIEDMAALYLKEVRRLQPVGPYYLGGASFGGIVAFEMALQLHAQGERAALVALFDTSPAGHTKLAPSTAPHTLLSEGLTHKLRVHLSVLLRDPDRLTYLRKRVRRVGRRMIYRTWQIVYQIFQKFSRPLPQTLQNIQQANYKALRDYMPRIYPGSVTLFYALKEPEEFTRDKQQGWSVLAQGGVLTYDVPGDHLSMVEEPHVRSLAEKLKTHIKDCTTPSDNSQHK